MILIATPPLTQLNTPYPASCYLKGYLNTLGRTSTQADLGIELILKLFCAQGLTRLFDWLENTDQDIELSDNAYRIYALKNDYIETIDSVISFLQNKNPMLAHTICHRAFLPEAGRFSALDDLDFFFGSMGIQDKARHLATLYLEDLGDLITEAVDEHFGFSRYAERLARTASDFDGLFQAILDEESLLSTMLIEVFSEKFQQVKPAVVCFSVPFPGNVFGAFKCAQWVKQHHPDVKIIMGGGYCNTELRSIYDTRVFDFIDFICLDDGEAPLRILLDYLDGKAEIGQLKRTFMRLNGEVVYQNLSTEKDVAQREVGTPDYADLPLNDYLSVIEVANPMHRLWSDGRWNKLTLAHGCYWGKCSFCDVSLDYIKNYEPSTPAQLCDRIEAIVKQTGQNAFHFVDEAAPPALLRDLAIELIKRKIKIVWWTNIRFDKVFSRDWAILLRASGCIALTGGLEVASDRLLNLMKKGVTVQQVAQVCEAFTQAGIMVHAYLMYGFPTQTAQETIDSLEVVRQMFEKGILQSGFWHQFAMTAHSPVGINPADYQVERIGPTFGGFAENDLYHNDPKGCDHQLFSEGLRISLYNYMTGVGFDLPLKKWFSHKVPTTSLKSNYIELALAQLPESPRANAQLLWLGSDPLFELVEKTHKGQKTQLAELVFYTKTQELQLTFPPVVGEWLGQELPKLTIKPDRAPYLLKQFKTNFETLTEMPFEQLETTKAWRELTEHGLLIV